MITRSSANRQQDLSDESLVETEIIVSGKTLAEGFPITISQAPGSLLIFYKAI